MKKNTIRKRIAAGMLAAILAAGMTLMPARAAGNGDDAGSGISLLNGDGDPIINEDTKLTQLDYIKEALENLREIGITPDVVLENLKEIFIRSRKDAADAGLEDSPAGRESAVESWETAGDTGAEGTEEVTESTGTVEAVTTAENEDLTASKPIAEGNKAEEGSPQDIAQQVTEDAESYVSEKVDEAKEQVKETAKEKTQNAISAFFDNLFK